MIEKLVRKNIVNMDPYVCARDLYKEGVFMDANENAFGSFIKSPFLLELNRYPDPDSKKLRKALGKYLGLDCGNIIVGSGSDQIIDLLIRLFVESDEEIVVFEPTYGMYKVLAEIQGARVVGCELGENFQIDFAAFNRALSGKTKLVFCCSPNNPTGNILYKEDILKICREFKGIVVVDEAYIEFSEAESLAAEVINFDNLVVLRTFSKAWGLAGLRVGYLVANAEIIQYINKIKLPYNLNSLSAYMAIRALENGIGIDAVRKEICVEKKWLGDELEKLGCKIFKSEANFILVKIAGAGRIVKRLAEDFGIIVRDFSGKVLLKDCFRITIGTRKQNRSLIQALTSIL